MKKTITGATFALLLTVAGCLNDPNPQPEVITDPPMVQLMEHDSITTGDYLGMPIRGEAAETYSVVQSLRHTEGVSHLNIVSNNASGVAGLADRIPLYSYILLDQQRGTDSGVQITLEAGKVKSLYLNSGKQLSQWPEKEKANASVRIGDSSVDLYIKLENISKAGKHAEKFERISLLTKDLSSSYDPAMTASPQWYFAYRNDKGLLEEVQIHLKEGKINYILVNRYK